MKGFLIMRRLGILVVCLIQAIWGTHALPAQVTQTDEHARFLAMGAVEKASGIQIDGLNTKRREDIEETLFRFQEKVIGHFEKKVYVYEVTTGGYHISHNELEYSSSTRAWLVAVSNDGMTFGLSGFADAGSAFNSLASKIGVNIGNSTQAELFARLYLNVVLDDAGNIVYDDLRLKHQVEEHFVGYADSEEPLAEKEARYQAWWRRFERLNLRQIAPATNCNESSVCTAVFNVLSMTIGRPPELWRYSVEVKANGMTRLMEHRQVFPLGSKPDHN